MTEDREELLRSLEQEILEVMGRTTTPVSKRQLTRRLTQEQRFTLRDVEVVLERLNLLQLP